MSNLFPLIGCCSLSLVALSTSLVAHADISDQKSAQIEEITIVGSVAGAKQTTGAARFIGPERLEAFHHSDIQKYCAKCLAFLFKSKMIMVYVQTSAFGVLPVNAAAALRCSKTTS